MLFAFAVKIHVQILMSPYSRAEVVLIKNISCGQEIKIKQVTKM